MTKELDNSALEVHSLGLALCAHRIEGHVAQDRAMWNILTALLVPCRKALLLPLSPLGFLTCLLTSYLHMYVYLYRYVYLYMCMYMYICIRICTCIYTWLSIDILIYIYICIYTCVQEKPVRKPTTQSGLGKEYQDT